MSSTTSCKQGGAQRGHVQAQIDEDLGDFEGVGEIGLAGTARLRTVLFGGKFEGALKQFKVVLRAIAPQAIDQRGEALFEDAMDRFRLTGGGKPGRTVTGADGLHDFTL